MVSELCDFAVFPLTFLQMDSDEFISQIPKRQKQVEPLFLVGFSVTINNGVHCFFLL
jgi:hypothetical protein